MSLCCICGPLVVIFEVNFVVIFVVFFVVVFVDDFVVIVVIALVIIIIISPSLGTWSLTRSLHSL